MANMMKLMKQAAAMQKNVTKMQEELAKKEYSFTSGGGMVTATVRGDMSVQTVAIQPDAVDPEDVEMLQDLVVAAVNGALATAREDASAEMGKITGGLGLPGM